MKTSCFHVFMLLNYMKAYISMYFLHLMLTFLPQNDVMVNGPLHHPCITSPLGFLKPRALTYATYLITSRICGTRVAPLPKQRHCTALLENLQKLPVKSV